jgi:hypothetical protein
MLENVLRSTSRLFIFIDGIPLSLVSYKLNKLFIVNVKHNNIFSFPYFTHNGDIFRSFRPSLVFDIF